MSWTTSNGVASYGPSQVSVSRMYSTWVSEWRRAAHERHSGDDRPVSVLRTTSSAPMPFSTVTIDRIGEPTLECLRRRLEPRGFRRDDRHLEGWSLVRVGGRRVHGVRDGRSSPLTRETVAVERVSVLPAPREDRDLGNVGEMPRKEALITPAPTMQTRSTLPSEYLR